MRWHPFSSNLAKCHGCIRFCPGLLRASLCKYDGSSLRSLTWDLLDTTQPPGFPTSLAPPQRRGAGHTCLLRATQLELTRTTGGQGDSPPGLRPQDVFLNGEMGRGRRPLHPIQSDPIGRRNGDADDPIGSGKEWGDPSRTSAIRTSIEGLPFAAPSFLGKHVCFCTLQPTSRAIVPGLESIFETRRERQDHVVSSPWESKVKHKEHLGRSSFPRIR